MSRSTSAAVRLLTAGALAVTGLIAVGPGQAQAATGLSAGDLVVYRVGSGSAALGSSATAVYLDEYSPTGASAASIPMPASSSGTVNAFTDSGTAASDGELTLSANGQYLAAAAYDAPLGTSSVSSTDAVTVARVDSSGGVDTSTTLPAFADGNNVRSAVTADGRTFWVSGGSGGIATTTLGSIGGTELNTSDVNVRQLQIQGGRLYASSDKNSLTVATVGTGLPTDPGQDIANLPGNPDSGNDPYGSVLFNLKGGASWDTLYVADDTAGKIDKYTSSGAAGAKWSSAGSVKAADVTGLTGTLVGTTPTLYATASGSSGTSGTLSKVTDSAAPGASMSGTVGTLATAGENEAFRGLGFRELRQNAAGRYLLIAGSADETDDFALYGWDGQSADAAVAGPDTPLPAGGSAGTWESIVSVPNPLSDGASVPFFQDNGDTVWYGDGLDSKDGLAQDFQKDLGVALTYEQ